MAELERMLSQLGRELDWPDTPELAPAVRARLAEPSPRRARRPLVGGMRRSLALALVLVLVLAAVAAAAVPTVRDAVLEFLGLQGATVERVATQPTPPPERPLDLGRRTTLEAARGPLAFAPLLPTGLGAPDGVYLRRRVRGGELSLAYRARPGLPPARSTRLGLLMSEFRGDLHPDYVGKVVGPAAVAERLVRGRQPRHLGRGRASFLLLPRPGRAADRERASPGRERAAGAAGRSADPTRRRVQPRSGRSGSPARFASAPCPPRAGAAVSRTRRRRTPRPRRCPPRRPSWSCRAHR